MPTISIDYFFFGDEANPATNLPVLVVKDRKSGAVFSHPVPSKGVDHPYGSTQLLKDLESTGYKRIALKGDQEASIQALIQQVKNGFTGEIVPDKAPVEGHEKSNGEVERAGQLVGGLARTLKEFLEIHSEAKLPANHPMVAWALVYAATLYTLFHREKDDGMTAYQRLKGKPWKVPLPSWGESVEFRLRGRGKMESRWKEGVYVGLDCNSTEKLVGDEAGIHKVVSIRRKPAQWRWNKKLVEEFKGIPWDWSPVTGEILPHPISLAPELPEAAEERAEPSRPIRGPKSLYITRKNLETHGFTAGCPACDNTRLGRRSGGILHTDACRKRMEATLSQDPEAQDRYERAFMKHVAYHEPPVPMASAGVASAPAQGASTSSKPMVMARQPPLHQALRVAAAPTGGEVRSTSTKRPPPEAEEARAVRSKEAPVQAQKRKHEGGGEEIEEAAMEAAVVHSSTPVREQPDVERQIMLLLEKGREDVISTVVQEADEQQNSRPVCEEPSGMEQDCYLEAFFDDVSGKQLEHSRVLKARQDEVDFIKRMSVFEEVERPKNRPVLKGRWVDVNKGDDAHPNYRSRYVGKEIKKGARGSLAAQYFAAMPPLSTFKLLLALATTLTFETNDNNCESTRDMMISFIDVKRAHFVSKAVRELYVELPPEMRQEGRDLVGRLIKSLYGTRDAAANWERQILNDLTSLGFVRGMATPCVFFHPQRNLRVSVHGDDFTTLGKIDDLRWFSQQLQKIWIIEERGILGPPQTKHLGTVQEMRHLNRIVRWTEQGIEYESDPRHAQLVVQELGVTKPVTTPLVKEKLTDLDQEDELLDDASATTYRSCTMRVGYLAQDRTDLQRTVREMAKGMSQPTVRHFELLKRCARYLLHVPRTVQHFKYQKSVKGFDVYVDTDHAGCIRTRKSTTGCAIMLGQSMIRSFCRGQAVVALSSGEAEYYGLVSATSEALGDQSIAHDLNVRLSIRIWMDATAGAAIGSRRGLGKVKHIHTVFLWVQQYVTKKLITISKVSTTDNYADIITKAVTARTIEKMMHLMNFEYRKGESHLAFHI